MQGLFDSCEEHNQNESQNINQKLITQGEDVLKYKGISIIKRNNENRYVARYRKNGKQISIYGKTQLDCYNNLKDSLNKKPKPKKEKKPTLKEWYIKFMSTYKKNKIKDTTIRANNYDFEKIKKLHNTIITEIKPIDIENVINSIPYPSTQKRVYILVNSLLQKAYDNDIIKKNIAKLVDIPKYKAKEKIALTHEEEKLFIEQCKNNKWGDFYLICLYQGLRKGEARALRVNDIDLTNMTLKVDESLNTHTDRTNTKNEQSNRIMPIFDSAKEILIKLIQNKKQNDLLFDIGINRVDKALRDILKNLNIRHLSTHTLRHTFITRCQEKNIPLYVVQSWVGHEKGSVVTTKIYTHLNNDINKKYVNIMNKKVFDTQSDTQNF